MGLSISPFLISKHAEHQHMLALPSIWNISPPTHIIYMAYSIISFKSLPKWCHLCKDLPTLHCHPFPSDLHFYRTLVTAWYIYVSACLCVGSEAWIPVLVREALTELSPQLPFVLFCLFTVCLFTLHKKEFCVLLRTVPGIQ